MALYPIPDSHCLTQGAYNLVFTTDFIFLVRRSAGKYKQTGNLNSMAYLGLVLTLNKEQEEMYRWVLQGVLWCLVYFGAL
ncbi:hypothetical protein EON63_10235 [archaeon]|nr:MAG: hypothetical protein EON63_10235 [archaeon]